MATLVLATAVSCLGPRDTFVPTSQPTTLLDWGPLAVLPVGTGERARSEGFLRVLDGCMVLVAPNGDETMLIWPSERTRWDAATGAVRYINRDDTVVTVHVDEYVAVGGGEGPPNPSVWINLPIGCDQPETFLVGHVGP